jgi:hypothetical protein
MTDRKRRATTVAKTRSPRAVRPKLQRTEPVRSWSGLFGGSARANEDAASKRKAAPPASAAETVDLGYRVVEDYLREGQRAAQAFSSGWPGGAGSTADQPEEMQQMAQRVLQYGWDFAGMWMEMAARMAGNPGAWPSVPGMPVAGASAKESADAPRASTSPRGASVETARVSVSIQSRRPATATVELRPGSSSGLVIHPLRAEGKERGVIRDVDITEDERDGSVKVTVKVPVKASVGVYNGMIVDRDTNLPRGTLSVRISSSGG